MLYSVIDFVRNESLIYFTIILSRIHARDQIMARLIPPGSEKKRFYTTKVFPGMVGGMIVSNYFYFLSVWYIQCS